MLNKSISITRLMILLFNIPIILGLKETDIPIALMLLLLLALNVQIRAVFLKRKAIFLSLLLDLALIYLIYNRYGGITYFSLLITTIDSIFLKEEHRYGLLLLVGGFLFYFTQNKDSNLIILSYFIFLLTSIFALLFKSMGKKIAELEEVYDEVRKYSYQLEVAKSQISDYSQQVEHLASLKERHRISEEIHDTIGHRLTALLMQMEAGIRLLDNDLNNGVAFLKAAIENLRESIEVLRQTVRSTMPKEYKNLILSFEEMIRKFSKETEINIDLKVTGNIQKLYPGVEMVLYKNAQEALTNAVRHGKAKNIYICLIYEANRVYLVIKNDGKSCVEIKKGIGISSMEERLKFVGGYLEIDQTNGFIIKSIIPHQGVEQEIVGN
ncbi:sensor histidine kinase [Alkaliphilus transvaalensis]|uniref:sensor histidine kinase n=1 Tax=Alkaliphilus transvaalensis TaxID=114628 RepID=UPI00047E691A|nr:sensor histidine kinase [Alkaliphilus transvaalensis]